MANDVRNFIRFIGNDKVQACMAEIHARLKADSDPEDRYGTGKIGRVLYGLQGDDAYLSYEDIGGKWIYYESDDDEQLMVVTGWRPAVLFQDYLLSHLVQLDPNVIVAMDYDDESPRFVGVRYVLMDDSEIQVFERELNTEDLEIVGYDELEQAKAEQRASGEHKKVITWEDLWNAEIDLFVEAYRELKADYPEAYEDPTLRSHFGS